MTGVQPKYINSVRRRNRNVSNKNVSPEVRQMAELQHAEIIGRLHACERLETEMESITDPRVLYGWNMLTQEVLIRLAEASLKLLYMLCSTRNRLTVTIWRLSGGGFPKRLRRKYRPSADTFPKVKEGSASQNMIWTTSETSGTPSSAVWGAKPCSLSRDVSIWMHSPPGTWLRTGWAR